MDNLIPGFFGDDLAPAVPPPPTRKPYKPDVLSYQEQLLGLERFCDKEPKTLKQEPTYKPEPGQVSRFVKAIDLHWSEEAKSLTFTVFRPANPNTRSPKMEIRLAIPAYKLAELGLGIPGEWKFINEDLNEDDDTLSDPFADED